MTLPGHERPAWQVVPSRKRPGFSGMACELPSFLALAAEAGRVSLCLVSSLPK